jgi:hypothetical protein
MPKWLFRQVGPMTLLGWIIALIAVVMAVALLAHGWNRLWSWLPWSTAHQLETAKTEAAVQTDRADINALQAEGESDQVRRLDTYSHQLITVQAVTAAAVEEARSAPNAQTRLETGRSARLRAHGVELCRNAPDLDGCPPAPSDAP